MIKNWKKSTSFSKSYCKLEKIHEDDYFAEINFEEFLFFNCTLKHVKCYLDYERLILVLYIQIKPIYFYESISVPSNVRKVV